jgi:hypothetical protein
MPCSEKKKSTETKSTQNSLCALSGLINVGCRNKNWQMLILKNSLRHFSGSIYSGCYIQCQYSDRFICNIGTQITKIHIYIYSYSGYNIRNIYPYSAYNIQNKYAYIYIIYIYIFQLLEQVEGPVTSKNKLLSGI